MIVVAVVMMRLIVPMSLVLPIIPGVIVMGMIVCCVIVSLIGMGRVTLVVMSLSCLVELMLRVSERLALTGMLLVSE